ncbi:serine hydrolase domain-containing protein [Achromobacter pestifer]|uniref:D-aminopeptidase n=1 Tax=Achromobacter pestifer TaxID=1353889 RepID=A0A6S6YKE5_9BURK|nr:serine hydrolase domain-containing protein [Achromobacter pestifer]CAB3626909.1 D-aminopeptidase [Achromobacter pestifer]
MFSLSRLVAIGSLLVAAGGCQHLPPSAPPTVAKGDYNAVLGYLEQRIPYDMGRHKVPGLSIAIVDDQRVVWSTGFGYADAHRHRTATSDTLYRVGAISKIVTAAGVFRASDEGRLPLDAPAGQSLPDWQLQPRRNAMQWMGADPYTARNLLTLHPATLEDTMGRARADMAYALLGDMVAYAAKEPLDTYVRRTILQPLNMPRAGYQVNARMLELRAAGYRLGVPWAETPQPNEAADGLWMSTAEMARFSSMLFAGGVFRGARVLKDESAQAVLNLETVSGASLDLSCRLALSWLAAPCGEDLVGGGSLREHSGATEAFHARYLLAPQDKLAVLVMSNSDTSEPLVAAVSTLAMRLMQQAKQGPDIH